MVGRPAFVATQYTLRVMEVFLDKPKSPQYCRRLHHHTNLPISTVRTILEKLEAKKWIAPCETAGRVTSSVCYLPTILGLVEGELTLARAKKAVHHKRSVSPIPGLRVTEAQGVVLGLFLQSPETWYCGADVDRMLPSISTPTVYATLRRLHDKEVLARNKEYPSAKLYTLTSLGSQLGPVYVEEAKKRYPEAFKKAFSQPESE